MVPIGPVGQQASVLADQAANVAVNVAALAAAAMDQQTGGLDAVTGVIGVVAAACVRLRIQMERK